MTSILRPRALKRGDVVAVAALSGPLEIGELVYYEQGIRTLETLGFRVRVSPLVDLEKVRWWAAAGPADVAAAFNDLIRDPEVRAIWALTGGRFTLGYLDHVDYDAVRADPKLVVGMSDIGALQLALHSMTGLATLHGELLTFGLGSWHELGDQDRARLTDAYRRVLTVAEAAGSLPALSAWETWRPGRVEGPLLGGMLHRLVRVQATPYALASARFDGAILFFEDVGTTTIGVWNDLQVLRHAGTLDRIGGLVVGPTSTIDVSPEGPDTLREIVLDVLGERDIPVLGNVNLGHDGPVIPLPLGVLAHLDADARSIELLEPAVEAASS